MNGIKTFGYLAAMTLLLVAVGAAMDAYSGGGGTYVVVFFAIAIVMNVGTYWFADTIVLKMHKAREVTPEEAPGLHAIVDGLVARSGLPKPKVCIVPNQIPNAFATGRDHNHAAVAVTEGLMRSLDTDELEGVIAHELAHIKNRDMLLSCVLAIVVGAIGMLATSMRWRMMFMGGRRSGGGLGILIMLFVAIIAPMCAMAIRMAISQQREFAADEGGALMSGKPWALAGALRKIEQMGKSGAISHPEKLGSEATEHLYFINHFSFGRAASKMFRTHPPTDERITRLLDMQDKLERGHGHMGGVS